MDRSVPYDMVPPADWIEPSCAGKRKRATVENTGDIFNRLLNPNKKRMTILPRRYYLKQAYRKAMRAAREKRFVTTSRRSFIGMRVRRHCRLMADAARLLEWREYPRQDMRDVTTSKKKSFAEYLDMKANWMSYAAPSPDENPLAEMFARCLNLKDAGDDNPRICCSSSGEGGGGGGGDSVGSVDNMIMVSGSNHGEDDTTTSTATIPQDIIDTIRSLRKEATARQKIKRLQRRQQRLR